MDAFDPEIIKQVSIDAGFDLVGFAPATIPKKNRDYISDWVKQKKYGEMDWFSKTQSMEIRLDLKHLGFIPKSVICLGMVYRTIEGESLLKNMEFKVSRYALGEDYHTVIRRKAKPILSYLKDTFPKFHFRQSVDTLPIPEKVFASLSGLGWMGKNTNIIHPELGSYFFISTILTDCPWPVAEASSTDHCGTCRACLDACPTGALTAPYELDARLCISHHNIEDRREHFSENTNLNNWLYGCDICQEVCPWNKGKAVRNQVNSKNEEFLPKGIFVSNNLDLKIESNEDEFKENFSNTSILRIGVDSWNRNLRAVKE